MKTRLLPLLCMCLSVILTLGITSCNKDDDDTPKSVAFSPTENPYGQSYEYWGEEYWKASYAQNCEQTLSTQLVELTNEVTTLIALVGDEEVNITLHHDKSLFLPLATILYDYPCPDTTFQPAEGQTLEAFLQEGAKSTIDLVEVLVLTFDGDTIQNLNDFRFLSNLFYFTGNPEQAECYDPCITGESQPGAFDGYMIMFRKMAVGEHKITMHGQMPALQLTWDFILNITVE